MVHCFVAMMGLRITGTAKTFHMMTLLGINCLF